MSISIACPGCEKKLKVADAAAGKKIRCPACKAVLEVPETEEFVEPDEDLVITEVPPPKKKPAAKPAWDKDTPPSRKRRDDEDDYGEEEEEEEERRPKKKKKKRRDLDDRPRFGIPHRGVTILVMGIASILIGCIPLAAWYLGYTAITMANEDLCQMSSGRMDRSGRGITQTGKICGTVGGVLGVVWLFVAIGLKVMDRL